MFDHKPERSQSAEEDNPFLLSFSDLMASLLAIFILSLIVFMIQLSRKQEELEKERDKIQVSLAELVGGLEDLQQSQDAIASALSGVSQRESNLTAMLEGIQKDLQERGIEVLVAENGSVLRIPEQQLSFGLGKWELPPLSVPTAQAIGVALLQALGSKENRALLDTVFIEGHTDSVPNSREMGNWGLSTYRAIALWNFWTAPASPCAKLASLRNQPSRDSELSKPLISVSGYADIRPTQPVADNSSLALQDRPKDRRIDIRFTLVASERKSLEGLQGHLKQMREKTRTLIERLRTN
jgi:flagellar motor protein MotB